MAAAAMAAAGTATRFSFPQIQGPHKPGLHASAAPPFGSARSGSLPLFSTRRVAIVCSASSGVPGKGDEDRAVKEVERLLEEKRRAELADRIASGEFTVEQPGFVSLLRKGLLSLGPPGKFLDEFFSLAKLGAGAQRAPEIPHARGSVAAVGSQAFFIPLYELFLIYGGIFRLNFGPKSFLIVSDPAIAKHILRENSKAYSKGILSEILEFVMGNGLIPADGEIWRIRRRTIVPALHQKYVATMIGLFGKAAYKLCEKLDASASDGEDVEMESLFSRLTLDIIGKAVFNYDFDSLTNDTGIVEAVYTVLREAEMRSTSPIPTWEIPIWKDVSPRQRKVKAALKLVNNTLDGLIAICKGVPFRRWKLNSRRAPEKKEIPCESYNGIKELEEGAGLADGLADAAPVRGEARRAVAALHVPPLVGEVMDDDGGRHRIVEQEELQFHEEYMNEQDPSILHFLLASGDDVSSKQLRDDLMTMLIAGHETSAALLTWTFYLLSKEPSVMSKLQEEVDTVLGDRLPTIEDMKRLKYTSRVISESLRLYPQPPVLIRRSIEDDVLGGYPIKRGEDIFISVWNLHRNSTYWVEPEAFNPERWPLDGPNPNEINQNFSYLPFGGGPRKCVGDMFASFETICAVAMLVRRFNFQMAPGAPPVEMTTGATIHTTEGLQMTVTRRTSPLVIPNLDTKIVTVNGDYKENPDPTATSGNASEEQGEVSTVINS
ncbi:hypothetical protein Taro_030569 [Colocasia esculenta]|uniref:Protein LUTEIN DEFICIENT 5, chloroplastic n=1 Tax=Colocasia esculenta TaxID=4460 RepID=A0A843VUE3_COLES|nr:hypothetical protein [Colocasia esculenta]